jgi:DNA-binding transcriptional MerR regulator
VGTLSIGQVARRAGVSVQAVRYYERRGLLPAATRRHSGQRAFEAGTVDLLRAVKQAQHVGFTLAEVEELLRLSSDRPESGDLLRERLRGKIADIDRRIAALLDMRATLETTLHVGCSGLNPCTDERCPFWLAPDEEHRSSQVDGRRSKLTFR